MPPSEDDKKPGKPKRIGASPASNDWDPGPVADQRLMNSLKSKAIDPSYQRSEDPLEEKHKAQAYRRDFRTVDYRRLSKTEDEKAAERAQIKAKHSSWTPSAGKPGKTKAPSTKARFASFGGSTISVDVIRRTKSSKLEASADEYTASQPAPTPSQSSPQAQLSDAQLSGSMAVGQEPPRLKAPREGAYPDSLAAIDGIGPALERLLYDLGIFHFDQIAGWTREQCDWVEHALSCKKGRIAEQAWVSQAIRLRGD
ncbi:hypothetical protein DYI37_11210 [Fulvimarina endophytica]|uniref:Uncharacterized protein n=1 Tax=Fulvimarina endophytica TaxID=2293836 RepID=A0A371X2W4_9HYPH|nr:hypothetical protein [Fulvimarina endophytica]RFC63575.1 hypothetical protein DYI37_11210 [Fulvimarina endophytica]